MRGSIRRLVLLLLAAGVAAAPAYAQLPPRKPGPFGDKPAGPRSLPGDNLPPFNMLDGNGKLVPLPKLEGPLHAPSGEPESTAAGPNLATATAMARAAVAACSAKGFRVGATVIDSIGEARAMLTADGSDGSHVFVAHRKALTALVFGTTSLKANADVTSGAAPMSKVTPDMFVMGGAVPIFRDGKLIGAIGVSGAAGGSPPGKADEDCPYAGMRAAGPAFKMTEATGPGPKLSDRPWLVVAGSTLALVVGNGPIMQFTFGVFLKPLTAAFGVERGVGSLALTIGLLATALTLPIAGRLADVLGPKRLGLIAVVLFALGVAAAGLFSSSVWTFMVLFALAGVAAAGQTPLVYLKAISARIDRRRGLALAIALTGVGIGSIIMPLIAQRLIGEFGWRGAYAGLALILVAVAVPALLLFIPNRLAASPTQSAAAEATGLTGAEALRTGRFWLLAVCLFLGAGAANGTIAHVVPLLTDRGVPAAEAATAMSVVGAAAIVGRLLGGWLIDRFWAPLIATVFSAGMIGGIAILLFAGSAQEASIATVLLGLGLGLEADLVGFLVSRYLGTRAFGALFGYAFAAFMLGSSLGPIVMGAVFDAAGSYAPCLLALMGAAALSATGLLTLGRYAYPPQ